MPDSIFIHNKKYAPISAVVAEVSYSRDYLTRLAREKKIAAIQVGRRWYVEPESLRQYVEQSTVEAEIRNKLLREERKQEQLQRAALQGVTHAQEKRHRSFHIRAVVASMLLLISVGVASAQLVDGLETASLTSPVVAGGGFIFAEPESIGEELVAQRSRSMNVPAVPFADSLVPTATTSQDVFAGREEAVLLLPVGHATSVEALFSDPVSVKETETGFVVQLQDEHGVAVGDPVPFLLVPTAASSAASSTE